jgi:hypothetical protein
MRFRVHVKNKKNKPCARKTGYMHLISWIHPRGSETLMMAKLRGRTAMRWWPKTLKSKLNFKGDYQPLACSGQMVLVVVRQGVWTTLTVAKDVKDGTKNDSRRPKDLLKKKHSDSLKNCQLTLSQGKLEKDDVDNDADNAGNRQSARYS